MEMIHESLPLVDDGLSPTAPIASPDCMELNPSLQPKKKNHDEKTFSAQLESVPAFHSAPNEYQKSSVHIEPFYRYRVHSDA